MAKTPPDKLDRQIQKAGLPTGGQVPFVPRLDKNRQGEDIIRKATVQEGPKEGEKGFVDTNELSAFRLIRAVWRRSWPSRGLIRSNEAGQYHLKEIYLTRP